MKTKGDVLQESLDRLVHNGEIPYQSNRRALMDFDIYRDDEDGRHELMVMVEGLDIFISDLEAFKNVSDTVAKQALAAIR